MPLCVPMRDLKDTAAFAKMVENADGPVTVTRNGRDALVVMTSDEYEAQRLELSRARVLSRMAVAEDEYRSKNYADGDTFIDSLRSEYGL